MSRSQHILVVDDEPPAREMVGDYLRMHGFDDTDSSDTPIRDKAGGTIAPEAR